MALPGVVQKMTTETLIWRPRPVLCQLGHQILGLLSECMITWAIRLVVRLRQRFHVLLLQQQPDGEFKRVAAEHKILGPGLDQQINISRVIRISRYSTPNYPVFKV